MSNKAEILVIGATGFIGRRLVAALLEQGFSLRCLTRREGHDWPQGAQAFKGDLLQPETLNAALTGVDTAYYLAHSMGEQGRFADKERQAAENFVATAEKAGLRRAIYLSGLGGEEEALSEHLTSRREVARILNAAPFKT
ncbi:MAG TPA: NAD-dependent epimerase/dehydratase family protein, partial [Geoalkalibacter subterraneus]|nr:NAD-dependent epimerase/dehydratase family protein [Geoalkalibacter subterraneus]